MLKQIQEDRRVLLGERLSAFSELYGAYKGAAFVMDYLCRENMGLALRERLSRIVHLMEMLGSQNSEGIKGYFSAVEATGSSNKLTRRNVADFGKGIAEASKEYFAVLHKAGLEERKKAVAVLTDPAFTTDAVAGFVSRLNWGRCTGVFFEAAGETGNIAVFTDPRLLTNEVAEFLELAGPNMGAMEYLRAAGKTGNVKVLTDSRVVNRDVAKFVRNFDFPARYWYFEYMAKTGIISDLTDFAMNGEDKKAIESHIFEREMRRMGNER